jgi:hypothetical protein
VLLALLLTDATEGRLFIVAEEFLDAAVYHAGREPSSGSRVSFGIGVSSYR